MLFIFWCEFELPSGVTCFQPEELPLVFLVRQVRQFLSVFVYVRKFISPSFLKDGFSGYSILGCQFLFLFLFFFLEYFQYVVSLPSGLSFSVENSAVNLIGFLLEVVSHFSLAFTIFSFLAYFLWCVCLWISFCLSYLEFIELPRCI